MRIVALGCLLLTAACQQILGIDDVQTGDETPDARGDDACAAACDGDELVTCVDGAEMREACSLGCVDAAQPRCARLAPSNGATLDTLDGVPATGDLVIPAGRTFTIFTDTGRIVDDAGNDVRAATEAGGVDVTGTHYHRLDEHIGALAVDSFVVESGATFTGAGTRALLILSRGDVVIRGTVDLSAGCPGDPTVATCPGPGGGAGATVAIESAAGGCAPGSNGVGVPGDAVGAAETGGAGGAFGAVSGAGGDYSTTLRGGVASDPEGRCPGLSLVPLRGGSGGGVGGWLSSVEAMGGFGGGGGGGGGGLQITSLTVVNIDGVSATAAAIVDVGGAGGQTTRGSTEGGGGGGSGGGILLEAPTILVGHNAVLVANGGGGGGGLRVAVGTNGQNGTRTTAQALGGPPSIGDEGGGGLGGSIAGGATAGGTLGVDGTGGGGGSVGIIRLNGRTITNMSSVVSPAASTGSLVTE